ncbi:hypothetical protein G5I_05185 [Acromyrmex echinatior]|uniref:Uncharacterized protein n=1 Tax=Acromyrmex echinatior TaxID=103372 RepID=F4WHM1_ACREC|nr:hypothetical protein G5I_05185 [Acromyrmex echinatior]
MHRDARTPKPKGDESGRTRYTRELDRDMLQFNDGCQELDLRRSTMIAIRLRQRWTTNERTKLQFTSSTYYVCDRISGVAKDGLHGKEQIKTNTFHSPRQVHALQKRFYPLASKIKNIINLIASIAVTGLSNAITSSLIDNTSILAVLQSAVAVGLYCSLCASRIAQKLCFDKSGMVYMCGLKKTVWFVLTTDAFAVADGSCAMRPLQWRY